MRAGGLTTEDLVAIALDLVGWSELPPDSAVYVPGRGIRRVLVGIDIGTAELLLARELGCDGVVAHHPVGMRHRMAPVYRRHVELMMAHGIPREIAEMAIQERVEELETSGHADNYDHVVSVARLLNLPFLNLHAPCDEAGRRILQGVIDETIARNPRASLQDIVSALGQLSEFREAETPIRIAMGEASAPAGKVVMVHGALTNGGYAVAKTYFEHGIDTVAYIHIAPSELARLRREGRGQLLITGHIASDSVGINPWIAELEARGVEVIRISGILGRFDPANRRFLR
ncbi:hypothetical protein [Thermoflexus sp.]|uniref:hypothetical protein n=1 Tax=Thermoflexus sp. TaxID=1969742 RepID=UPI0035E3F48F